MGQAKLFHRGIKKHLHIDAFTDSPAIVSHSKKSSHLEGVVLDILYDHFLSLHWDTYCNISRKKFLEDFCNHRLHAIKNLP